MRGVRQLSPRRINRIFQQQIQPTVAGTRRAQPTVLFVVGQPGAGKSSMQDEAKRRLGLDGAYVHDADNLVRYHPDYEKAARQDDLQADQECAHATGAWDGMALDHAVRNRMDVVVSTPLGDQRNATALVNHFRREGYRVEVAFAAVHESQSQLGILDRLHKGRLQEGFGRWVPGFHHDNMYDGLPQTADMLEYQNMADGTHVFRRGGEHVFSNYRGPDGNWQHPPGTARRVIDAERNRPWTAEEVNRFQQDRVSIPRNLTADTPELLDKVDRYAGPKLQEFQRGQDQARLQQAEVVPTQDRTGGYRQAEQEGLDRLGGQGPIPREELHRSGGFGQAEQEAGLDQQRPGQQPEQASEQQPERQAEQRPEGPEQRGAGQGADGQPAPNRLADRPSRIEQGLDPDANRRWQEPGVVPTREELDRALNPDDGPEGGPKPSRIEQRLDPGSRAAPEPGRDGPEPDGPEPEVDGLEDEGGAGPRGQGEDGGQQWAPPSAEARRDRSAPGPEPAGRQAGRDEVPGRDQGQDGRHQRGRPEQQRPGQQPDRQPGQQPEQRPEQRPGDRSPGRQPGGQQAARDPQRGGQARPSATPQPGRHPGRQLPSQEPAGRSGQQAGTVHPGRQLPGQSTPGPRQDLQPDRQQGGPQQGRRGPQQPTPKQQAGKALSNIGGRLQGADKLVTGAVAQGDQPGQAPSRNAPSWQDLARRLQGGQASPSNIRAPETASRAEPHSGSHTPGQHHRRSQSQSRGREEQDTGRSRG